MELKRAASPEERHESHKSPQIKGIKGSRALSGSEDMDNGGRIVFLIFMILIVSAILREVKKKTSIPFSPMLLLVGLILGIFEHRLGFVGECVRLLNGIDPHSLLMIFIPGLVFEGSYNTDTYVFGKSKW